MIELTVEEEQLVLNIICDYISEYVFKTTPVEHKKLLLSVLHKFGVDDEYYTNILGGKE